jgi:hypothetical protein
MAIASTVSVSVSGVSQYLSSCGSYLTTQFHLPGITSSNAAAVDNAGACFSEENNNR